MIAFFIQPKFKHALNREHKAYSFRDEKKEIITL